MSWGEVKKAINSTLGTENFPTIRPTNYKPNKNSCFRR